MVEVKESRPLALISLAIAAHPRLCPDPDFDNSAFPGPPQALDSVVAPADRGGAKEAEVVEESQPLALIPTIAILARPCPNFYLFQFERGPDSVAESACYLLALLRRISVALGDH